MSDHDELRTPVSLQGIAADDPHLAPAAHNPQIVERVIAVTFVLGLLLVAGFGACYWVNAKPWTLGATMGGGLTFLGIGLIAWGKYLMPRGPFVEERHELANSEDDRNALAAAIVERGGGVVKRRKMLAGLLGGGSLRVGDLGRGHQQCAAAVAGHHAIEQADRIGDRPSIEILIEREGLLEQGVRIA